MMFICLIHNTVTKLYTHGISKATPRSQGTEAHFSGSSLSCYLQYHITHDICTSSRRCWKVRNWNW